MDDIFILHESESYLIRCLSEIETELGKIGFEINKDKTHIIRLTKGFTFLGFVYRITSTGKIVMTLNSANIKHERKKLLRMVNLAKEGKITRAKADECFKSWCANASKGNSYKLIQRMKRYYYDLWRKHDES